MSAAGRKHSIFAPIPALAFSARQLDDCKQLLTRRSENTELVPVSDVEQLLLTADGKLVESGYRFNFLGFQALANAVAPGLHTAFTDLSGEVRRSLDDQPTSLAAAVSIYNTAVRAKIDTLRERSLLVDNQAGVVEGFLGLNHRMLDNSVFLEIVTQEMQVRQPTAQFYRAELVGREIHVYYVDPASHRKDIYSDSRHSLMGGWVFNNREDRGKSVNGVRCLLTRFGVATERAAANMRLTHVGADMAGRTSILVARAAARELDMPAILSRLANLQTTSLELTDEPEKFEQALTRWATFLARLGVMREDAKVIARNAAMVGADLDPRDPVEVYNRSGLGARTGYDLFCAILRCARNEPGPTRDRLQTVAMELLLPPQKKKKKTR